MIFTGGMKREGPMPSSALLGNPESYTEHTEEVQ